MDLKVESKPDKSKPARPHALPLNYYARTLASEARRFRQGITRENVTGFLKNMAWTVPLTVLIWVYAEREQEVPVTDQPIAIEVKSRDPLKVVTLDPREKVITCDLKGPRSNLDRFRESLSTSAPITIELDTRRQANQEDMIPTLENLRENPRFKEAGITIEKCTPPSLTVYVDSLETRNLPVAAPANIVGLKATFSPATVSVTGPSHVVDRMTELTADIGALASLNQPGTHPPEKVSLVTDPSGAVTYSPGEVLATLTVAAQDIRYTCGNIPVWLDIPPSIAGEFSISLVNNNGFVSNVNVIGPPEQIAKLQSGGEFHPRAVLEISPDNVNNTNPVPLKIEDLPDNVRVDGPNPEISFTATRRG
jgi:hypothetical protein